MKTVTRYALLACILVAGMLGGVQGAAESRYPWQSCDDPSTWIPSPIWGPGSPRFSSDTENKQAGSASLRVDYTTDAGSWFCIGISPAIHAPLDLSRYGGISFRFYNPDAWGKRVGLSIKDGKGKSYWLRYANEKSYSTYGGSDACLLPTGPGWTEVRFFFDDVHADDRLSSITGDAPLKDIAQVMLVFTDQNQEPRSGYFLLDDVKLLPQGPATRSRAGVKSYPSTFDPKDSRYQAYRNCMAKVRSYQRQGKYQKCLRSLNEILVLSPNNAEAVAGVLSIYREHSDAEQRARIKGEYRKRYYASVRTDEGKADGYRKLHQTLVDIASDGKPLFSYCLGTQTIGPNYKFTAKDKLAETAEIIRDLGSDTIKLYIGPQYAEMYAILKSDDVRTLKDIASRVPTYHDVLGMPFKNVLMWTYPLTAGQWWTNGIGTRSERDAEYREVYDLAKYLLETYNNSGKTFLLGNWEGDWHLTGIPANDPSEGRIAGMTEWFNIRQKAIDDAKKAVKHSNVSLYHYMEVNAVPSAMKGAPRLANRVLPYTAVDFVSYSSYASTGAQFCRDGSMPKSVLSALDYIESRLPPKDIPGKRVWLGEFGFALLDGVTPEIQDRYTKVVGRAALEWGCPFALYWEVYCNEYNKSTKRQNGFWLINDKNEKQPVYYTFQGYYRRAVEFMREFERSHHRPPTRQELGKAAVRWLN